MVTVELRYGAAVTKETKMQQVIAFLQSEQGRRLVVWISTALGLLIQGGVIPLDYAIPGLGITTGQAFVATGLSVAATSGSSTRK